MFVFIVSHITGRNTSPLPSDVHRLCMCLLYVPLKVFWQQMLDDWALEISTTLFTNIIHKWGSRLGLVEMSIKMVNVLITVDSNCLCDTSTFWHLNTINRYTLQIGLPYPLHRVWTRLSLCILGLFRTLAMPMQFCWCLPKPLKVYLWLWNF